MTPQPSPAPAAALDALLARAEAADRLLGRRWQPHHRPSRPGLFPDRDQARTWLTSHAPAVAEAVCMARQEGLYEQAWRLCASLSLPIETTEDPTRWIPFLQTGVEAAHHRGPLPCAVVLSLLGRCLLRAGELGRAETALCGADHYWRRADQPRGRADILCSLGNAALLDRDGGLAEARYRRAWALYVGLGDERGMWTIRYLLGEAYLAQGRYDRAVEYLRTAWDWFADHGDHDRAVRISQSLERALCCADGSTAAEGPTAHMQSAIPPVLGPSTGA
ncbi:tetratricopeptide repeat protein [Nocardiopsis dassonvillei]|uniref:tetratricopeptide repeat protein n=1 Tax=Nocardiopsis dassonvillei TaxID=2014 RepID=UPI00200E9CF3|nr:tetratricopeptide repeat protein [Nocardiopsis dassonvillei]MCK9870307.1 tetratricopeptide repeat protein [Nocardiopsis dassonvillei]